MRHDQFHDDSQSLHAAVCGQYLPRKSLRRRPATVLIVTVVTLMVTFLVPLRSVPDAYAAAAWSTLSSMPTAREGLAVAAVKHGNMYAIGGLNSSFTAQGTVEAYTPATDSWAEAAPMPTPRTSFAVATTSDGRIVAIGGTDGNGNFLNTVEVYTSTTDSWAEAAPMPTARDGLAAVLGSDGRIYAIGGFNGSTALDTVEAYNPTTNSWATNLAPMPTPRFAFGAARGSDGRIYAFGGTNDQSGTALSAAEVYDPATNNWATLPPMPTPRFGLAAALGADGLIYAVGGIDANFAALSTVEVYSPASLTWGTAPSMPTPRGYLGATISSGILYAIGGENSSGLLGTVESYPTTPSSSTGSISGVVHLGSGTGAGIAGAPVQACPAIGFCKVTQTASDGSFTVNALTDGTYTVTAFAPAATVYTSGSAGPISISGGNTVSGVSLIETVPQGPPPGTTLTSSSSTSATYGNGVPIMYWGAGFAMDSSPGCVGAQVTYQLNLNGSAWTTGAMPEGPVGHYTVTFPPPLQVGYWGNAHAEIDVTCPGSQAVPIGFDFYIDPSGTVQDQNGHPVSGATVTLYQRDATGNWVQVPDGSDIMAPFNSHNPDVTDSAGYYGWDVLSGTYKIRAAAPGCTDPNNPANAYVESGVLAVPPAITGLTLTLNCPPANTTPTVAPLANATINEGSTYATTGSFADPDIGDAWTATVDYGDGSGQQPLALNADKTFNLSHIYDDNGVYTATVKVTDKAGATGPASATVTVNNVPPTITSLSGPTAVLTGANLTYKGMATDPSKADTQAGFTWNWSVDGTAAATGNPATLSFATCGSHTVSATATDKDGGVSAPASLASAVSAYDGAWQSPLYVGQVNVAKAGSVIPVKIIVGCNGALLTGLAPSIQLIKGDVDGTTDTGTNYVATISASAADTTGVMRYAAPQYIYNLQVPTAPSGTQFTVRVRPFGDSDPADSMYVLIQVK